MDDIVERLYDRGVCSPAQNSCRNDFICEEAAAEITRLRAKVGEADKLIDELIEHEGAEGFSNSTWEAIEKWENNWDKYLVLYQGPIEVGMTFVWEPNKPHARQVVSVVRVTEPEHDERKIWTSETVWNDESRFREAVVDVTDIIESKEASFRAGLPQTQNPGA